MSKETSILILGIGNILWADEGFGVRAVDYFHRHYQFPNNVRLMDGGTQGIYLLEHVQLAEILVVLDAIDYSLPPGTLKLIEGNAVPKFLGAKKMSLHQTGFQEVLAMAEMLGSYPQQILLAGVQPKCLEDYGGSLSEEVKLCIEPAINAVLDWLGQYDISAQQREQALDESQSIAGSEIDITRYEKERPTDEQACRVGDERVLTSDDYKVEYRPHPLEPGAKSVDVDHRDKY